MPEPNLMASAVPLGRAYEILEDGAAFGGYTIVRCLAYDMLGSLYLAQNRQSNQRETLFVFPSLVNQDRDFNERFMTHTKKLCSLSHPNLLHFTRPLIVQNSYCLVGEPFEGLSMPDHLMLLTGSQLSVSDNTQAINLPTSQVTPILEQALTGLGYAHECKVMHLNLNPTKILRSAYGEVKVYGYHFLALLGQELFEMLVSAGIPPLKLDPHRSFLGTTDILSPEARLRQPLEYRSDIYALGVDTHWLLTGRKPTSPYKPPSQLVPNIEQGWDALIFRCLQRKADDRYATAGSMLADLRNLAHLTPAPQAQPLELLLAPEPPAPDPKAAKKGAKADAKKAKPARPPRRARKPLSRVQRLLLYGAIGLLVVGAGASLYPLLMTEDEDVPALGAVRVPEGRTPRLSLFITPRNAMVTIKPGGNVFKVSDGELRLNMAPGEYMLEVESPRHRTQRLPYQVQPEPDQAYINLEPDWATVAFTTAPGATLQAQPERGEPIYLGVAGADGVLRVTRGLGEGVFTFEATKEHYAPATLAAQKLELGKSYALTVKPAAQPATVTLLSQPAGMTVRMGERILGTTPLTTREIPVDTDVTLTLQQTGYQPVERPIRLAPNWTGTIDLGAAAAKTGALTLAFTLGGRAPSPEELRDTKITINDRVYPAADVARLGGLLEGGYRITFNHPDYQPALRDAQVTDGQTATAQADLAPRPARLTIRPAPAVPVTIFVDGRPAQAAADGSLTLAPGRPANVLVSAPNFSAVARTVTLGPNQSEVWTVPLQLMPPPEPGKPYSIPYLDLAMRWIPPGSFTMGSPGAESERKPSEGPPTNVEVPTGFWAGTYEVTQPQYRAVLGGNPSQYGVGAPAAAPHPVEMVSWQDAVRFALLVNERETAAGRVPPGYEYRLPTEVEWEYFARAGTTTPFSFGAAANSTHGNFKGSYPRLSGSGTTSSDTVTGTRPVGSYPANAWGLHDIHGNVREWVLDVLNARLPGNPDGKPLLAPGLLKGDSTKRAYRGGGWADYAVDSRTAWRHDGARADTVSPIIGFRLVLAPKLPPPGAP